MLDASTGNARLKVRERVLLKRGNYSSVNSTGESHLALGKLHFISHKHNHRAFAGNNKRKVHHHRKRKFNLQSIEREILFPEIITTHSTKSSNAKRSSDAMPAQSGMLLNKTTYEEAFVGKEGILGEVSATLPYIDRATPQVVTAYKGITAIIPCFVNNIGQRSVSIHIIVFIDHSTQMRYSCS